MREPPEFEPAPDPRRRQETHKPSEDEVAIEFIKLYEDTIRYDHDREQWFIWNNSLWEPDKTLKISSMVNKVCRDYDLRKYGQIRAVENIIRHDQSIAARSDLWDRDPWLMGTPIGTLDLRDGSVRTPDQGDFITRCTLVGPRHDTEKPELWLKFLDQVMIGDQDMIDFLQIAIGYTLTGLTSEQQMFFNWGTGGNGKGTFFNVIAKLLDDYHTEAAENVFTDDGRGRHTTDLAMLDGARMVTCSENTVGQTWNEERVKRATGGDKITARFMNKNNFSFNPIFKLWFLGNNRPALRKVDMAMRRRLNLIPWRYETNDEDRDGDLENKLMNELPAIFRWCIDGCLMWQRLKLVKPVRIKTETDEYFSDEDKVGNFISECCDTEKKDEPPSYRTQTTVLFAAWMEWCKRNGEISGSAKTFTQELKDRGFEKRRTNAFVEFLRIRIKPKAAFTEDPWLRPLRESPY